MVQVREAYPLNELGKVDILRWIERLPGVAQTEENQQRLLAAAEFAKQHNNTQEQGLAIWGESYNRFFTGLEMAEILADLNLDTDTLVAAILYRTVRDGVQSLDAITQQFGKGVAELIEGVAQMAAITQTKATTETSKVLGSKQAQQDHIRKMLVALVDDVRVALIKLAERTCAIRAVKNNEQRRDKVAREVFEIYAPLAHRLGIGHIKWELEDLSFRYLEPEEYKRIAKQLDERRLDRQQFIKNVTLQLEQEMQQANIEGEVNGRVKHIYSIWRKMQRKKIDFSEVYDIRAVRILVKDTRDCYAMLGIVHTLWKAIPNEFDDYIALPKENGYRSLHTAVIGPDAKVLEVQIRTYEMHEQSEFGVCAHWQYKGADKASGSEGYEDKIAWLKQVLDEHDSGYNFGAVAEEMAHDVAQDKIYVFTPDGHVVELAYGATPLDFAYRVHTEVGHRCRGAKVNGRIVPLTYTLETGQQIEILTGREGEPSREWLRPSLGYIKTPKARAKVKAWFKQRDRDKNIVTGRTLLEREFRRLSMANPNFKLIAEELGFPTADDLYVAAGSGDIGVSQALKAAQRLQPKQQQATQYELSSAWHHEQVSAAKSTGGESAIQVSGVGNLLTQMANCCKPLPGDLIGGYVTLNRGVSVHRQDCPQFLHLQEVEKERVIEVSWGQKQASTYPVDIRIEAYDREGLLRDITTLLATEKINVIATQTRSDKASNTAQMLLTIEISGIEWLSRLLARINQLPNIISVQRVVDSNTL